MLASILVVDDSATIRRVVGRTLTQAGYEVRLASDGREALEAVQERPPDLVLVDFMMPHMNGLKFVQAMREIANLKAVPVVLMSALADKIGDGFVAQTEALDAIRKPFAPTTLLSVAEHALTRARERPQEGDWREDLLGMDRSSIPPEPISIPAEPVSENSPLIMQQAAEAIVDKITLALGAEPAKPFIELEPQELFALINDLSGLVPGHDGEDAFVGRLEHVALGEILQMLVHQRQTGVLEVAKQPSRSGRSMTICLKDGAVQMALGRVGEDEFRLGRYLRREGLIDAEDLTRILKNRTAGRGLLGARLVKLGYISADELTRLLVQQTSELIYEALRWKRGRYRFLRFASRPEADDAALGLPLASLLMEGLRRVDEWRLIEEQIHSFDDVPRRDEEALRTIDLDRLSEEESRVLEAVDGARTIREIIDASSLASFEAAKVLFQMLTSRLVRI